MISARSEGIESWAGSGVWSRGAHSHRIGRARPASFMTMADVSAPSAPAAGQQEAAQPTWGETLSRIVRSAPMYVLVMQIFGGFQPGLKQTIDAGASSRDDAARGPVARRVSSPMFSRGEPLDFYAYITHSPDFDSHGDPDALVEIDTAVPLCGAAKSPGTGTGTSPGTSPGMTEDTGEREYSIVHSLRPEDLERNATPHSHVFFARRGKPHDPRDERYDPEDVFGASTPLFRFYPKPKKRAARKNLLSGETTDVPGDVPGTSPGTGTGTGTRRLSSPGTGTGTGTGTSDGCRFQAQRHGELGGRLHDVPVPERDAPRDAREDALRRTATIITPRCG